jgi:CHAT domain-containing protein
LDTAGLDDYRYAQTLPSPSSFEDSETGSTKEKVFAKSQAQMRWQKAFLYALAKRNPTLNAALPSSSFARDASSIKEKIPSDTAVIEYALVTAPPEGLISIVITSEGIAECAWQRLDTLEIQRTVADLLSSMQSTPNTRTRNSSPTSPRRRAFTNASELRETLSSILIRPIQKSLSGKKKLIIVPSGELAHVPWTLLLQLPVSIVPSLSIWDHLHSHSRESPTPSRVSVVGNPPRNEDGSLRDRDIPFSYMEAFYIARLNQDFPFLAGENNRKQFQDWVATTRSLHLCAHSTFDTKDPARSGIQLFNDPLTIHDWRDLAIKADLVVFSSCLSSISKAFHSGSSFGFAHALLGTGTRAFIGSLWPVDDQATLLLMMMFYEQLRKFSPAEALHNAQMMMRNLTEDVVWDLVVMLQRELAHPKVGKFVDRHKYWMRRLADLRAEDLQKMREPRCWAAFVLTGYGFQHI